MLALTHLRPLDRRSIMNIRHLNIKTLVIKKFGMPALPPLTG